MEWRLSSRPTPRPEEAFACGSQSTRRILSPSSARQAERLMAVVVLPTPPFWFTTPRIFPMAFQVKGRGRTRAELNLWRTRTCCGKLQDAAGGSSYKALLFKDFHDFAD